MTSAVIDDARTRRTIRVIWLGSVGGGNKRRGEKKNTTGNPGHKGKKMETNGILTIGNRDG